ncbi:MAG TPA: hypothetical protein VHA52_10940 [Candidatus Babeliaceae bacterium]|nr:hypothetical protein [Candidatus Babeliaceae bacterium]
MKIIFAALMITFSAHIAHANDKPLTDILTNISNSQKKEVFSFGTHLGAHVYTYHALFTLMVTFCYKLYPSLDSIYFGSLGRKLSWLFLDKIVADEDINPNNEAFIRSVVKELHLEQPLLIKHSTLLGKLIFGKRDIQFLYGINTLVLDEEWFETLPQDQKKFIVGHGIANAVKDHALVRTILELFERTLHPYVLSAFDSFTPDYTHKQKINFGLLMLLWNNINRSIVVSQILEADFYAASSLNAYQAGINHFQDLEKYEHDGSWIDWAHVSLSYLFNTIPLLHWFSRKPYYKERIQQLQQALYQADSSTIVPNDLEQYDQTNLDQPKGSVCD